MSRHAGDQRVLDCDLTSQPVSSGRASPRKASRTIPAAPATQTVAFPGGQYKLYGSGTTPLVYWVWIPSESRRRRHPSTSSSTVAYPAAVSALWERTDASPYYWYGTTGSR